MKFHLLAVFLVCLFLYQSLSSQSLQRFEYQQPKMGTIFGLILYATDSTQANRAADAAFDRIDSLNHILSDYDPKSEINQLVRGKPRGQFHKVSEELWTVLRWSKKVSKKSRGAFDVSIGPLSKLWRRAFRRQTFPDLSDIEEARKKVNYRWIKIKRNKPLVRIKKEGMELDLGGVAKGYAVDEAYETLQKFGLEISLVDGGGDIYAGKAPPGRQGWKIVRSKLEKGKIISEIVLLEEEAMATSGDTYRFMEWEGKRYSHLIDPRSGMGTTERRLVMVRAPNCMQADALASASSIWEASKLKKLAHRFDIEILVIWQLEQRVIHLDK